MKRCQTCNILGGDNQINCYTDGQPLVEDSLATTLQEAIGEKYSLTRLIGKGAMGAVYGAHHRDLGDVAIKVMLAPVDNQTLSERFLREARALRKLRHQNAVLIYDLDRSPTGVTYMVMEMVAGRSLGQDLRERKRLTLDETMEAAEAVCSALAAAHERGIIHRDLKPDNILRAEEKGLDGRTIRTIKIADFGIVKERGGDGDVSLKLTKVGKPIGTPFYMSPEQWFGDGPGITALDHRTDIYALGCTLYELLSGRPPFLGRTTSEMRRQHLHDEPPPLHTVASHVPLAVSRVIMRALSKDRDERQQSATEFFEELSAAYDESFQRTNQKLDERLRSTQESMPEVSKAATELQQQQTKLHATEESVLMFQERIIALDTLLPNAEQEQEADSSSSTPIIAPEPEQTPQQSQAPAFSPEQAPADSLNREHGGQANEPYFAATHAAPAKKPRRKTAIVIAIALLLIGTALTIGLALYIYRSRPTPATTERVEPPPSQFKPPTIPMGALSGTLRLSATPGSEVFVDDEKVGAVGADGFFNMKVPVGLRNVRVVSKNYRVWISNARIRANQTMPLTAGRERPVEIEEAATAERKQRAVEAYKKKDYDTAEAAYRELLKADSEDAESHAALGLILNAQQRYSEAIPELEVAARLDSKNAETLNSLARLYLLKERDREAETTARQLVSLAPRDANTHHLLARALSRDSAKLDEALSEIEAALKSKQSPEMLETKAYILLARNSMEEALKTAERAAELDHGKSTGARAAVAVILFRMERVNDAVANYGKLRQEDKSDRWGDIRSIELQRAYSRPVLETLAALIARTN
jgi:serine/threonine protein kinase/Flp pilus assembly protein TadD